ncbi:MAG: HAD family phosphatase [Gammaproteobacteria bacterium]|nr:HAD family phosphatase [Gammaproteobacteria bacterium]
MDYERIELVLFDMGGVVVSVHPRRVFRHWAQASGVRFEEFVGRWSIEQHYKDYETGRTSFEQLVDGLNNQLGIGMSIDDWKIGWNELVGQPFQDVLQLVQRLASELPVYCFTNSNPEHESIWANNCKEELSVFRAVFNSSTIGLRKPDVDAFLNVSIRMETSPSRVLFLDDNRENVRGAIESGMQALHVPRKADTIEALSALLQFTSGRRA